MAEPTPPQTVGPFFKDCFLREDRSVLAGAKVDGEPLRIEGRVLDGDGAPVDDAVVEIWQADADGRYRHPLDAWPGGDGFTGFGRAGTDREGRFRLDTIKPGRVETQAPHLNVQVFARGLLDRLATRIYFDQEPANDQDPVLTGVPADRRGTLIARRAGEEPATYRFDVILQGDYETVFFDA